VQHEWVNVSAQLSDHERDTVRHQAADEMNVAAEPVQLGHGDMALEFFGSGESGLELGAAVKRISTVARLDLQELPGHFEALNLREARKGVALRFNPKTRASLLGC
jgi:hypothetical protein